MNIKKYLKLHNHLILFFLSFGALALLASYAQAGEIQYTPNIAIPGSQIFGGGPITITPNTLAEYIKAIYRYAGIIAGAFAMFMLVYGAWQWLMAAGNASKIAMAKETVTTTLVGLAFLFGGYLLLSQISTRLVNLQPLVVKEPVFATTTPAVSGCENKSVEDCSRYAGCEVKNGVCVAGETMCGGMTQEQVVRRPMGLRCCRRGDEYAYAIVNYSKPYCSDVCGSGWMDIYASQCQSKLGY